MFGGLMLLVGRGFGEAAEGAPPGTGLLSRMQQDTLDILDKWGETLTIKRRINTYSDTGVANTIWTNIDTFTGDWQPLPGSAIVEEEGLEIKSKSQIMAAFDTAVLAGDRIYRDDGTFEYVNYVRRYEDHITIRMKKTEEG